MRMSQDDPVIQSCGTERLDGVIEMTWYLTYSDIWSSAVLKRLDARSLMIPYPWLIVGGMEMEGGCGAIPTTISQVHTVLIADLLPIPPYFCCSAMLG